jgi:hypothetical protein
MRPPRKSFLIAAFLGALAGGCSTTEGRCEDVCEWTDNCLGDAPSNCVSNCEGDYDDAGDPCQEAFDDLADCLSDNDLACNDACDGEFAKYATECIGQFG